MNLEYLDLSHNAFVEIPDGVSVIIPAQCSYRGYPPSGWVGG